MSQELVIQNDDGFDVQERTNSFIVGGMIKYDNNVYTLNKTEPLPLGTVLIALSIVTAWVEWRDQLPVKHYVTQPGQHHPAREDFGDMDKTKWPPGYGGQPGDPFKDTRYLHLINPQTGQDYTFVTDTTGGRMAVGDLKSAIRNVRIARPGAVAVVKLGTGTFKSKRFGLVPRAVFEIVEYRGGTSEAPAQIADQSKPLEEVKAPSLAEEMNDELPYDLKPAAAKTDSTKKKSK